MNYEKMLLDSLILQGVQGEPMGEKTCPSCGANLCSGEDTPYLNADSGEVVGCNHCVIAGEVWDI